VESPESSPEQSRNLLRVKTAVFLNCGSTTEAGFGTTVQSLFKISNFYTSPAALTAGALEIQITGALGILNKMADLTLILQEGMQGRATVLNRM
jgi:hypothetical protein